MTQLTLAPQALMDNLTKGGLTKPNHCYTNAAQIVLGILKGDGKYVLCWMWDAKGVRHGHAIIEYRGNYFDTTLQANGGLAKRYEIVLSLTADELRAQIELAGGDIDGTAGFIPPALLADGSIACEKVEI